MPGADLLQPGGQLGAHLGRGDTVLIDVAVEGVIIGTWTASHGGRTGAENRITGIDLRFRGSSW
jgi:hypothetical protein